MSSSSYAQDVAFLRNYTDLLELSSPTGARTAVAPEYQGRVMTSALSDGRSSFGWINRQFIASGTEDEHLNNYGGEDRFWLGPEAGQFGLWFAPGEPFTLDTWKTPKGFGSGPFEVSSQGPDSVAMTKRFTVTNASGTTFRCAVTRRINALTREQAARNLRIELPAGIDLVGFESVNTLTNHGSEPWTKSGGLVSIWTLGQFTPLPRGRVIVPIVAGPADQLGPRARTDYFVEPPPERCAVGKENVLLRCDGRYRCKIGIPPARAKQFLGSYDPEGKVLTIVQFNLPTGAEKLDYVNSVWEIQDDPYAGDVVNSYNDGEASPGAGQRGPFYEMETSSPAAALGPGDEITHIHRTFHLRGPLELLAGISGQLLAVDVRSIA